MDLWQHGAALSVAEYTPLIDFFADSDTFAITYLCNQGDLFTLPETGWNLLIPCGEGKALSKASERHWIMDATRFQGEYGK